VTSSATVANRFEHWCKDNQVYFITARCRDKYPAFASEPAKAVFWDRFDHYTALHEFVPWVTSLLDNHYHVVGYCKVGETLGEMMRKIHGSVAKLVNDLLPERRVRRLSRLPAHARAGGVGGWTGTRAVAARVYDGRAVWAL